MKTKFFIFSILLTAGFFGFWGNVLANENHLIITELLPNPSGIPEKENEFIELYNPGDKSINLIGWYFKGKTKEFMLFGEIGAKEYKAFYNTITLYNEKSIVKLFNSNGDKIDVATYPKPDSKKEDFSYSLILNNWIWVLPATPNKENYSYEKEDDPKDDVDIPKPEVKSYSGKIKINEIYPEPETGEKEFVEFYNTDSEAVDLAGWKLRDENLIKKENKYCVIPDGLKIESKKYVVFYLENCSKNNITLNNGGDIVEFSFSDNNLLDSVAFGKANKKSYSLNFDNNIWQWTSKITKGGENEFDEILSGEIKKDKKIYAGIYADFEAKAGDKAMKFTWNFGDGHKSYLRKTRHKYEKAGDYNATLKITGDGEDNILSFAVAVEDFKKAKIKIIGFLPNPAGKDSENEWIEIQNNTKKKINLKNWSIATGWEKLSNHPIKKDFILKPKETKKLTRDFCAFTLGNKQAKVELRYPNGKTADKVKYDRKKNSVDEGEIYQKEGKKWQWVKAPTDADTTQIDTDETLTNAENMTEEKSFENNEPSLDDIEMNLSGLGKYSEDPDQKNKYKKQIALIFFGSNINPKEKLLQNQEKVLGISTIKKTYIKSARENNPQNFSSRIWKRINARMNRVVDVF